MELEEQEARLRGSGGRQAHTHLEEARFLLKLLELGLDPVAAPDVRRVPSSGAGAADLHRLRGAERVGAIRRGADLGAGSGSVSGLGRRASGEEEDEELSRNAGGRRTEKALPFLVSERGLSSDTGGFILTTVPGPTLSLSLASHLVCF